MSWVTTLDQGRRTARKPHYCNCCSRVIDKGEEYFVARCVGDDGLYTFKQCIHCLAVSKLYDPRDDDNLISEDGFAYWTDKPRDLAELRAIVGFRMRWRTKIGTLLPVPDTLEPQDDEPRDS